MPAGRKSRTDRLRQILNHFLQIGRALGIQVEQGILAHQVLCATGSTQVQAVQVKKEIVQRHIPDIVPGVLALRRQAEFRSVKQALPGHVRLGKIQSELCRRQRRKGIQPDRTGGGRIQGQTSVRVQCGERRTERNAQRGKQVTQFQVLDRQRSVHGSRIRPGDERPLGQELVPNQLGTEASRQIRIQDPGPRHGQLGQVDIPQFERRFLDRVLRLQKLQDLPVGDRGIIAAGKDQRLVQIQFMDQQTFLFQEGPRISAGIQMGGTQQGIHLHAPALIPFRGQRGETLMRIRDQQILDRNGHIRKLLEERQAHVADAHSSLHLRRKDLQDGILQGRSMEKHLERHQDQQYQSQQRSQDDSKDLERQIAPLRHDSSADYRPIVLKKSLPLSSTRMKAGKSTTSIFQMASIPSSGYSTHSMLLMFSCARMAAGPPMEPR